ncbi:uncharacterized protein G2W53_036800 [Senna tora]|uniref:Uncharacterized protein n=1 Tax=Senna tora TaxID=362788 RepID=A0A834SUN0_9FABA|nr:uncharacterized protein G2W53_036800 [Senna tora]
MGAPRRRSCSGLPPSQSLEARGLWLMRPRKSSPEEKDKTLSGLQFWAM